MLAYFSILLHNNIVSVIWIHTDIEKYVKGQHCNNMEKYANTIRVLVTHVSLYRITRTQFTYI